jgi:DNA-binding beta-propeller fold protein YncE
VLFVSAIWGSVLALAATSTGYQVLVADGPSGTIFVTNPGATGATAIPAPVGGGIESLAISPDGSRVYVAFKDGMLGTIDTASDSYLGVPVELGASSAPSAIVVTPNGKDLYVAESALGQVVEVNALTGSLVGAPIETGPVLNLAISPDGVSLFVDGGSQSSAVTVVATATNTLTGTSIPSTAPGALLLSAKGTELYVLTGTPSTPALLVIDPATDAVLGAPIVLPATSQPEGLALSTDGTELYVTDGRGQQVVSVATSTGTLNSSADALPAGFAPRDIAVTPDGATVYVDGTTAAGTAALVAVDLATGGDGTPIPLTPGTQPAGLLIAPASPAPPPTPTPTPTPTPSCAPTGIGPTIGPVQGGPIQVAPGSSPTTGVSSGASAPGPVPSTSPSTIATPPPEPTASPSPTGSTGSSPDPILCCSSQPAAPQSTSPTSGPTSTIIPLDPTVPPSPASSPRSGPERLVCFGALAPSGLAPAPASLARANAASPSAGLLLPGALAVLGLSGGGLAMAAGRSSLRLPRLNRWRNG